MPNIDESLGWFDFNFYKSETRMINGRISKKNGPDKFINPNHMCFSFNSSWVDQVHKIDPDYV